MKNIVLPVITPIKKVTNKTTDRLVSGISSQTKSTVTVSVLTRYRAQPVAKRVPTQAKVTSALLVS